MLVRFLFEKKNMTIYIEDMDELKRLATNTYEQSKMQQIHRIINGITELQNKVQSLTLENNKLKKQLSDK